MFALILISVSLILAMNMGVSGFSVSFTPSYGSNVLTKNKAVLLYTLCVFLGGTLVGVRVVQTLVKSLLSTQMTPVSGLIIISACALTMLFSNLLKVPQSTSFVTVASFVGAGLYYGKVNWGVLYKIIIFAVVFSIISFIFTLFLKRKIYPPHPKNLKFYEKFFIHRDKFKKFIVFHDIYAGFGIGTNNVANVVAPLVGSLNIIPFFGFLLIAPFFGLGAHLLGGRVIHSVSKDIVPLGEISASIISFVTATFVIIASFLGLPTPYVQFTTFSLIAISCVKDGLKHTIEKTIVKRILWVWLLVPLFTTFVSFILHVLFLGR